MKLYKPKKFQILSSILLFLLIVISIQSFVLAEHIAGGGGSGGSYERWNCDEWNYGATKVCLVTRFEFNPNTGKFSYVTASLEGYVASPDIEIEIYPGYPKVTYISSRKIMTEVKFSIYDGTWVDHMYYKTVVESYYTFYMYQWTWRIQTTHTRELLY